jgi:hypothetical protein
MSKNQTIVELLRPALKMVREAMQGEDIYEEYQRELEMEWEETVKYFNKHGVPYESFPAMKYIGNKEDE